MRAGHLLLVILTTNAIAQQPRIDSIGPAQGPIAGGTLVTIRGANFAGADVRLDRNRTVPLSQTATEIRLQMPAHDNGYAIIAVGSVYARYLYLPPTLRDLPPGFITTVAGIGNYIGEYGPARSASVQPLGIAFDAAGTLHFADPAHNRAFRVRDGILEPVIGTGLNGGTNARGGLPAIDTPISFPRGIAFDSRGNLYVPDTSNYLWRVTPSGVAEIVAGNGREAFSGDGGLAIHAEVGHINFVTVDTEDNVYFIDVTNARVRRIDRNGNISTYAGTGRYGFSGDGGLATQAQFSLAFADLGGLAIDREGNLLLLDYDNARIRRIDRATGIINTIAGPTVENNHRLNDLNGLAVGPNNQVVFGNASEMLQRSADGTISRITTGTPGFSEDGSPIGTAKVGRILALAFDHGGNLYYTDSSLRRIRSVDTAGRIITIVGIGPATIGEGGPATAAALLTQNLDLDFLPSGELAMADYDRLRKIDGNGNLVRIAGSGVPSPQSDIAAAEVSMFPLSVASGPRGVIDFTNGGVFRIDSDGIVRHTAGLGGPCGFSGDAGDARQAILCQPWDARRDAQGNLFIADTNNNRVRRVDAQTGAIATFAGSGAVNGLERYGFGTTCGDGGPATSACINTPYGVAFDDAGNVYVEENEQRIRKIDRLGIITTLAEVPGTKIEWAFGNLFTVHGEALSRISPSGVVTQLTGHGLGFSGDGGLALTAQIFANKQGHGVAVDAEGNLFFDDGDNLRVRAIRFGAVLPPQGATIQATGNGAAIRATVFDGAGRPAPGVRVDFSVPPSGPSCVLATPFAITDSSGSVNVSCASNCIEGSYVVTATPLTATSTARIAMTNARGPCGRQRAIRH